MTSDDDHNPRLFSRGPWCGSESGMSLPGQTPRLNCRLRHGSGLLSHLQVSRNEQENLGVHGHLN